MALGDQDDPILRINQVMSLLGRSRSSILRDVQAGRVPRPLKTGPRSIGWLKSEIMACRLRMKRVGGDGNPRRL